MKSIVVDSSSIISLSEKCLLWLLHKLKKSTGVHFIIPEKVKIETMDRALGIKRFELEGTRVMRNIANNTLEVVDNPEVTNLANEIFDVANKCFYTDRGPIKLIHEADCQVIALAKHIGASGILTDERIMRTFIEDPQGLRQLQSKRLHTGVKLNENLYQEFKSMIPDIFIIRSVEIAAIAYQKGAFAEYLEPIDDHRVKHMLIEGMMWSLKYAGCAMSEEELEEYIVMLEQG
jgi:predicted nucleic acid-binding protein